jgi:predicted acylesterase/phospholipase RssA
VPDIVVGTSIGAVVGGSYAAGHLDTLEAWARGLLPRNIFSYLDIRLSGSGLIGGSKLAAQLEASFGDIYIDELPLKFAAVSTEVNTGHEIWVTNGKLVDAVRASYALPGIFEPVLIGERWLVDGALVNPGAGLARARLARKSSSPAMSRPMCSATAPLSPPTAAPPKKPRRWTSRRYRKSAASENSSRRRNREARILRQRRTARHLDRDGRSLQHHAGPHHALASGW